MDIGFLPGHGSRDPFPKIYPDELSYSKGGVIVDVTSATFDPLTDQFTDFLLQILDCDCGTVSWGYNISSVGDFDGHFIGVPISEFHLAVLHTVRLRLIKILNTLEDTRTEPCDDHKSPCGPEHYSEWRDLTIKLTVNGHAFTVVLPVQFSMDLDLYIVSKMQTEWEFQQDQYRLQGGDAVGPARLASITPKSIVVGLVDAVSIVDLLAGDLMAMRRLRSEFRRTTVGKPAPSTLGRSAAQSSQSMIQYNGQPGAFLDSSMALNSIRPSIESVRQVAGPVDSANMAARRDAGRCNGRCSE